MQLARGDSGTFTFTVTDSEDAAVDLTDAEIRFTVTDLAGETVLELANTAAGGSDDEIEITGAATGVFDVKITTTQSDLDPTARWADCVVITGADPAQTIKVAEHEPFYVTGT
jgi:hypothetical protein